MKLSTEVSAVITGGGSGLGEATARHLASFGVKVAILDKNPDLGQALAHDIGGVFAEVDVTDTEALKGAFEQARNAHGQERIFVACAGIAPAQKTVSRGQPHDPALFGKTLAVNLEGTFNASAIAAAGMAETSGLGDDQERGVIIMTASVAGYEGQIGQAAYAASKGGVIALTLPMARDLAGKAVRVMTIAPGLFETPMLLGLPQEVQESLGKQAPYPARLAYPSEYASLVQQIVENPMMNGSVVRLDGAIRLPPS